MCIRDSHSAVPYIGLHKQYDLNSLTFTFLEHLPNLRRRVLVLIYILHTSRCKSLSSDKEQVITWPKYLNSVTNCSGLPPTLKHGKLLHTIYSLYNKWASFYSAGTICFRRRRRIINTIVFKFNLIKSSIRIKG